MQSSRDDVSRIAERDYLRAHILFNICRCAPVESPGCADCKVKADQIIALIETLGWTPPGKAKRTS